MTPLDTPPQLTLGTLRLRLRPELRLTPRDSGSASAWIVEDPVRGKFYEVGAAEQSFLAMLDGRRTLDELAQSGNEALSPDDAATVARWLLEQELVQVLDEAARPLRLTTTAAHNTAGSPISRPFNPLAIELFTIQPQPWLAKLRPLAQVLGSRAALGLWSLLALAALMKLGEHAGDWSSMPRHVLDPTNWQRMGVVWCGLKFVHELGHALLAMRYGAPIGRAGMMLMLFAPVAFVDVSASWRLTSRWQRIAIAAAGMLVELAVAFGAILLWTPGGTSLVDRLCVDVALIAGGHTLLFNLNPLMRFDGYFILSDLLGITNLATESRRRMIELGRHWFSGLDVPPHDESYRRTLGLLLYGLAASAWRCTMWFTLVAGLVAKWETTGVVAAVVMSWFWWGGTFKARGSLPIVGSATPAARRRSMLAWASAVGVVLMVIAWLASPAQITAPAIVEYAPLTLLRADTSGWVEHVAVHTGQVVEPGDTLLVLRNDDLELEWQRLQSQGEQAQLQARRHLQQQELSQQQGVLAKLNALDVRLAELQRQRDALTVRSPRRGTIVSHDLAALAGRYLAQGDVLLALGADDEKELLVSVPLADEAEFAQAIEHTVQVTRRWSDAARTGRLSVVEPRARHDLPHEALGAHVGGAVVVRITNETQSPTAQQAYQSLEPRLLAKVSLDGETSGSLRAGERVSIAFHAARQSWARRWCEHCISYLRQLAAPNTIVNQP